MSKETTAKLAEMVRKNTTENQREHLVAMGLIDEHGLLKVTPVNLQLAAEAALPMGEQQAVRLKGRVEAVVGITTVDINLFKDRGGRVFADSNIKGAKNPTTGKRWTTFVPKFSGEMAEARRDAWNALKGILPAYLAQAGTL